jgi:hypothetical protein
VADAAKRLGLGCGVGFLFRIRAIVLLRPGLLHTLTAGIILIWKEVVVGEGLIRDQPQCCNLEEKFRARVCV